MLAYFFFWYHERIQKKIIFLLLFSKHCLVNYLGGIFSFCNPRVRFGGFFYYLFEFALLLSVEFLSTFAMKINTCISSCKFPPC